jgi:hypothetical protein
MSMFAERLLRSDRASENDAGLGHCRSDDFRIIGFAGKTLVEKITVGAPSLQGRLHRRGGYRQIEKALRCLIGFELSRHGSYASAVGFGGWAVRG